MTVTTLGNVTQAVGPAGGTVTLGKASIVLPAGALQQSESISIEEVSFQSSAGGPSQTLYVFGPEGLTFATPATVNLPGTSGGIRWSEVQNGTTGFIALPTSFAAGLATANVTHFSVGSVGTVTLYVYHVVCALSHNGCPVGFRGTPAKGEPIVDASELCPDEQRSGWRGYPIVCYPGGPDAGSTSPDAGGSGTGHPDAAQSGGDAGCPGAAENLRATLAGQWSGACGGDVLSWNISASGSFTGSNSNGQTATGTILADGSFSESGNGAGLGPFTAMGTITVAASCNAFTDSYSYMIGEGDGSNSCTAERSGADGG